MNTKHTRSIRRVIAVIVLFTLATSFSAAPSVYAAPGDVTRVSVDSSGAQANGVSGRPAISDDGRFVAFESVASNLVPNDTNNVEDIFVKDRQTGMTTRVSVRTNGAEANGSSTSPAISADGRFVAFYSDASNLLNGDTNGFGDIFVHDRQNGETRRVSVDSSGAEANAAPSSDHYVVSISGDGRFVAYYSDASNLVSGDTNGVSDIFVYDRQSGRTTRASVASNGSEANGGSTHPNLSTDGRYVTFASGATNLVAGEVNLSRSNIFVRDLQTGSTTRVSVNTSGAQADGGGTSPDISGDGRYVVFMSASGNLDPRADEYRYSELVYVHDRQTGQTTLASVYSEGGIMTVGLFDQPTISRNGRYVAFSFYDKGDNNGILHVWVRDLQTGQSIKVEGGNGSGYSSLSADGKFVAFNTTSSNLVSGDTNGVSDVFVREVAYGPERNPTVASVTPDCGYSTPVCAYPTAATVPFIVIFSEPVSGVSVDDFSLEMLEGITGASITGVSGSGVEYFVTVATGTGDGRLRLNVIDNDSIVDTALNPLGGAGAGNANFTGKKYQIDKSFPIVTSIVRTDPNPAIAGPVRFTVTFSEVVYPVRSDDFVLSTTGSISGATITAIDPIAESATYTVTVDTGTGDGTLRLDLIDDDSISDNFIGPIGGMPLGGEGVGNGNFTTGETYTISKSTPGVPSVTSSVRLDANPTVAASVTFAVIFSEYVNGVDSGDFSLSTTGSISGALVTNVSGSGTTYQVTAGTGSGAGDLRLDVVDNDSILYGSSSPLGGPGAGNGNFTSGQAYTINRTVPFPTVVSSLSSDTNPTNATTIHFDVIFSEAVSGVDLIDFTTVTTGNVSSATVTSVSGSGTIYSVTVNLGSGDGTVRLDVLDDDSIVNASNSPLGGPGAGNGNFMGGNYTISQTLAISILRADPAYNAADFVHFNVTFTESVSGVDASDFVVATSGVISSVAVTGVSGSGNTYIVTISTGSGDGTLRIDLIDDDSIINTAGNPLGGVGPGNGNFIPGETYSIERKNAPIMFSSLRLDANPTTAPSVRFIVTFSEAVTGVDVSDFALTTTNISGASIGGVEIGTSGFTFIVTVSTGSGNGTLRLDLIDNDSIVDDVNHPLGGVGVGNGSFTTGEVYTVNRIIITPVSTDFRSTGASDGWVLESKENSNVGGSKNSAAAVFKLGDDAQNRQFRSILHFPTYYLPDNAVITQVILTIKKQDVIGTDPFTTHQNILIDIRKGFFSNFNLFSFGSLQLTDFQAPADAYAVGAIQNNPVDGWYWATLDSRAFPYINLTDITQLRLGFQLDDNNDRGEDHIRFLSGNYPDQKDRPHLLIEYYVPQ